MAGSVISSSAESKVASSTGSTAALKSPAGSSAAYMAPVPLSLSGYAFLFAPVPVFMSYVNITI